MYDRIPETMILEHMGLVRDEGHVSTSTDYAHIDDGAWTYLITVMQWQYDKDTQTGRTVLHTWVAHECDDMWTYKLLHKHEYTDEDLFTGLFHYTDDENKQAGHIQFFADPDREPIVIPDKEWKEMSDEDKAKVAREEQEVDDSYARIRVNRNMLPAMSMDEMIANAHRLDPDE